MASKRDWDKGKEHWKDDYDWVPDNSGYYNHQEDDYYRDGKRRKFNNGVSLLPLVLVSTDLSNHIMPDL
jgi:hypothetical protein